MTYTSPAPGVYKFPTSRWRSVAVYRYRKYWECEEHGYWNQGMMVAPCEHIRKVREEK
jgi:hypothetical protein